MISSLEDFKKHLREQDNGGQRKDGLSDYDFKEELQRKEVDSLKIILKLMAKGSDVNYTNNRNLTPLYYAREHSPQLDNNENSISAGEILMAFSGLSLEKEKLNSLYGYDKVTQSMVVSGIGNNDNLLKLITAAEEKGLDVKKMLKKGDRVGYNDYSFADGGYKYFRVHNKTIILSMCLL